MRGAQNGEAMVSEFSSGRRMDEIAATYGISRAQVYKILRVRGAKFFSPASVRERFEERYIPEPTSGCWLWIGALADTGYGQLSVNGKRLYAHAVSLDLVGRHRPAGLQVDHVCRNRACVNPAHLRYVSQQQNIILGSLARRPRCKNGHALSAENTYRVRTRPGVRICRRCLLAYQKARRQR